MDTVTRVEVLIVGATPAGLALAIELGGCAIRCLVVDRAERIDCVAGTRSRRAPPHPQWRRWGLGGQLASGAPLGVVLKTHALSLPSVSFMLGADLHDSIQDGDGVVSCVRRGHQTQLVASRYVVVAAHGLRSMTAGRYRHGRLLLAGDACHVQPPAPDRSITQGIADGVNLGWKLAALLRGWGGADLLDSYESERRPLHEALEYSAAPDLAGSPIVVGAHAEWASTEGASTEGASTENAAHHGAVHHDGARCGSLAPHAWLAGGRSLYAAFGPGFTLLATGGWTTADLAQAGVDARRAGFPLALVAPQHPGLPALYRTRLALIRPDQVVAWRGAAWPFDGMALLRHVSGKSSACWLELGGDAA